MISAFKIQKKHLDLLSGTVYMDYCFGMGGKTFEKSEAFANLPTADAYIEKSMRDWFLGCMDEFFYHKKQIIQAAHPEQQKALQLCEQAVTAFHTKALQTIVDTFLRGYDWFKQILPNPNNPSYQTSVADLNEFQYFCEYYNRLKQKK